MILVQRGLLSADNELGLLSTLLPFVCLLSSTGALLSATTSLPKPSTPAFQRKLCYEFPLPLPCLLSSRPTAFKLSPVLEEKKKKNPSLLLNRSQPSPSLLLRAAHAQSSHIPLLPRPTDTLDRTLGSWDIRDSAPTISTHLLSRVPSDPWNLFIQMAPSYFNFSYLPSWWHLTMLTSALGLHYHTLPPRATSGCHLSEWFFKERANPQIWVLCKSLITFQYHCLFCLWGVLKQGLSMQPRLALNS